jgi:threonine/homoserine/homoserine lactone efflux protein
MGHALGNVLPLAVAVAIFPVPIIAAVLVVGSDRGVAKGLAFVLAWCAGLGLVGTIGLLIGGVAGGSDTREPAEWVNVLLLVLGVLLLWLAVEQWRARPAAGEEPPVPGWVRTMGDLTVAKAAGAGFALSALNPKNALLAVAAAAEIIEAGLSASQQVVVLVVFVVVASVGVLAPVALALALGERSRGLLDGLRVWMARHNAAIMAVLFLLIGAKLIGDAVSGFST